MPLNRVDLSDRFADMWRTSREAGGKTQEYMAKALGVSKKTVQNWENGTSCPTQVVGFQWFLACGVQPLPYYLKLLYFDNFDMHQSEEHESSTDTLVSLVKALPVEYVEKLLFLLSGTHGSSPLCVLEMINAHLQSPLRERLNIAESIYTNYDMAAATDNIRHPDDIQPNMKLLEEAISAARKSIKNGGDEYNII